MKKYFLTDDLYCRYLAKSKKDMIDYIKMNYKSGKYDEIEKIKDCDIYFIKYNGNRIEIDDYFGDILAIERKNRDKGALDYDEWTDYGIKDGLCKKDFLYHNL